MQRRVLILATVVVLFAAHGLKAQAINGSIYSYFGVGGIQTRSAGYNRALGFTGIAVRDDYNLSITNPAAYNAVNKPFTAIFETGASYESIKHQDDAQTATTRAGGLNNILFMFKLKPKWAWVAGVSPLTTVNYRANSSRTFGNLLTTPVTYEGSGGVNQFFIGTSYELFKGFSVGGNLSYYIGSVKRVETVTATAVTDQLSVTNETTARNVGYDVGFQYQFSIREKTKIIIGGTYDPGAKLGGLTQISVVNSNLDTLKKTDKFSQTFRLPPMYGGGLGVKNGRSTIAADVRYLNWKMAQMNDGLQYRDTWRYSVGYELRGDYSAVNYLNAIAFRAGGFVDGYQLMLQGTTFNTWGYTFGLGFPVDRFRASINVNYVYTSMGTTVNGLVHEESNRLVLDFIIRDVWGQKRKFD